MFPDFPTPFDHKQCIFRICQYENTCETVVKGQLGDGPVDSHLYGDKLRITDSHHAAKRPAGRNSGSEVNLRVNSSATSAGVVLDRPIRKDNSVRGRKARLDLCPR